MRRRAAEEKKLFFFVLAAAAGAGACHSEKRPVPVPVTVAATPDAGVPAPDPARVLLETARARRARIEQAERRPEVDTAAVAAEARACAYDAHRSWAVQFPEAAAAPDLARAVAAIGTRGAEALYLEAVCTASWARMQGFTPLIERRDDLMAAFIRVVQVAPDLDGAGADRELGALYAALPSYAGGDLQQARRHLEDAIARAPADPRNRIVMARAVAVKAQDRALFEEQLAVAAKSADAALAAQAEALLQKETDLFGPAEAAQPVPGGPQR